MRASYASLVRVLSVVVSALGRESVLTGQTGDGHVLVLCYCFELPESGGL